MEQALTRDKLFFENIGNSPSLVSKFCIIRDLYVLYVITPGEWAGGVSVLHCLTSEKALREEEPRDPERFG